MQAPVTAEEARVRRNRLQSRMIADAQDRFTTATTTAALSTLVALPLHRIKYMSQCIPEYNLTRKPIQFKGGFGAAMHIWKNEGVLKLWRGASPAMLFTLPVVGATQFATINFAQDMQNQPSVAGSLGRGVAVSVVTAAVSTLVNTFDMAHVKMATDLRYPQAFSLEDGTSTHVNNANPLSSSLASSSTTTNPLAPKNAQKKQPVTFSPYQYRNWLYTVKRTYNINGSRAFATALAPLYAFHLTYFTSLFVYNSLFAILGLDQSAPFISTVLASGLTTLTAHPFDTIRTRMFYRLPTEPNYRIKTYSGMLEAAKYIWDHEGAKGFMRGSGSAVAIFASTLITNGIAMTVMNSYKRDRMQREYIYKMQQYAQEERAQAMASSRSQVEQIQEQEKWRSQSASSRGRMD